MPGVLLGKCKVKFDAALHLKITHFSLVIRDRVVQTKVARMPVERYASEYNMNHSKRGIALIFNHEIFEIPSLKPRAGTNVDCDNLCKALTQIHFDVKLYKDLRLRDIMQRIEEGLCHKI